MRIQKNKGLGKINRVTGRQVSESQAGTGVRNLKNYTRQLEGGREQVLETAIQRGHHNQW